MTGGLFWTTRPLFSLSYSYNAAVDNRPESESQIMGPFTKRKKNPSRFSLSKKNARLTKEWKYVREGEASHHFVHFSISLVVFFVDSLEWHKTGPPPPSSSSSYLWC